MINIYILNEILKTIFLGFNLNKNMTKKYNKNITLVLLVSVMFLSKVILINAQHFPYMPLDIFSIKQYYFLNIIFDSIILFFLFKENLSIDISLVLYNFIVNSFIDLLYYAILLITVRFDYHMLEYFQLAGLIALLVLDALYFYLIRKYNFYIIKSLNKSSIILIKLIPFILLLELANFSIIYNNYIGILMNLHTNYSIYTFLYFIASAFILFLIFRSSIKKIILDNMTENYNTSLKNLEMQKEEIINRKNQIAELKSCLQSNLDNYNETNNDVINTFFDNISTNVACNSFAVNTVINDFSRKFKKNNIIFNYSIYNNINNYISDVYIVGLISNLLQNSFEEVINIKDKHKKIVDLKINKGKGLMTIECKNFKSYKREIFTQKKVSGEGTKIIKSIVSNLDGKLMITNNDFEYSTLIVLYYENEEGNNDE